MWCTAERRFVVHVCLRNPFPPFFLEIKSIHSLLVPEAWASWERNAPPALQYGRIMPMPSLQLQKKASLMQRSRGFGHGVVACKICFDIPYTDCAPVWLLQTKLLASVGWKWGCQPFSCRCSDVRKMWRTAERRFVVHICLRNPFPPFLLDFQASTPYSYQKLELPESGSTLHQLCLNHGCRKNLSYAEKQWSANQRTLVQIELLATMGWKWGCQPFSCRCSQNVMHCRKELCSTCLFQTSLPAVLFWNSKYYSLPYCKWSMYSLSSTAKSCCFEDLTKWRSCILS